MFAFFFSRPVETFVMVFASASMMIFHSTRGDARVLSETDERTDERTGPRPKLPPHIISGMQRHHDLVYLAAPLSPGSDATSEVIMRSYAGIGTPKYPDFFKTEASARRLSSCLFIVVLPVPLAAVRRRRASLFRALHARRLRYGASLDVCNEESRNLMVSTARHFSPYVYV